MTFRSISFNSFLCSEGILLEDLIISDLANTEDSVFCIHLQRQYSAAKELDDFLRSREISKNDEKNNQKVLKALQVLFRY